MLMKSIIPLLALAISVALSPVVRAADAPAVTPQDHIELFNGKDFTGWKFAMKGDVEFVALGKPQANRVTVWWRCVLARPSARSYLL